MSPQRTLNRSLYESLPLIYGAAGFIALIAGYRLRGNALPSLLLTVIGIVGMLMGLVIWLRRRDYRRLREHYRVRGPEDELNED